MGNWKHDKPDKQKVIAEWKERAKRYQKKIDKYIKLRDRAVAYYTLLEKGMKL
jgi:hypothetical protein